MAHFMIQRFQPLFVGLFLVFISPLSYADSVDWVDTTMIINDQSAPLFCPTVCGNNRKYAGSFKAAEPWSMKSQCACREVKSEPARVIENKKQPLPVGTPNYYGPRQGTHEVYGGYISWDNYAKMVCPDRCGEHRWTGNWRQTNPPRSDAACECDNQPKMQTSGLPSWPKPSKIKPEVYKVQAGKIESEAAAKSACPRACKKDKWNGKWHRGVLPQLTGTCECISP